MTLFQRIKTPSEENDPEAEAPVPPGLRSAGGALRQQREALGLDLSDVAGALRIKPAYLAAIEEGRPDRLPGPAYAIGFVRAYSDHLGLDSAEILRRLRLEAAGLDTKPDLSFPMPLGERSVPGSAMLLVALILAICGYGTWYYLSTGERSRPERVTEVPATLLLPKLQKPAVAPAPAPAAAAPATSTGPTGNPLPQPGASSETSAATEPAAAPAAPPSAAPTARAIPTMPAIPAAPAIAAASGSARSSAAVPAVPITAVSGDAGSGPALGAEAGTRPHGAVDGPARIVLQATADSWIQVRGADRTVLFTGVLKPGDSYRVPDQPGVSMRAGNAGGIEVVVDGKPMPSLGPPGAVRNVALDPQALTAGTAAHD